MASLCSSIGPAMDRQLFCCWEGVSFLSSSFGRRSFCSLSPSSSTRTHRLGRRANSRSRRTSGGGGRDLSRASSSLHEATPSLAHTCHRIELCFFEVCVQNLGRPMALALHGFVSAAMEAYSCGYTRDQISLQLAFGSAAMNEFEFGTVGNRLTSTEEHYRSQWLDTVYTTLQILNDEGNDASPLPSAASIYLYGTVKHVIDGQKSGDEQSMITFDRGLATRGVSGGVAAGKRAIAPQLVPISQIVLLTLKVVNERGTDM